MIGAELEVSPGKSGRAVLAYIEACQDWGLSDAQERALAGGPDLLKWQAWADDAIEGVEIKLPRIILVRLAAVIGIDATMRRFMPRLQDRRHWITAVARGPIWKGKSPLQAMTDASSHDLIDLHNRLDLWALGFPLAGTRVVRLDPANPITLQP